MRDDTMNETKRPIDPDVFASTWIDEWNRRDIEAMVSHYTRDVRFVSPVAAKRTGSSVVIGREALAAYWSVARQYRKLVFTFESFVWDPVRMVLVIVYRRQVNDTNDRAVEIFHFNPDGLIRAGEAMYGAADINSES